MNWRTRLYALRVTASKRRPRLRLHDAAGNARLVPVLASLLHAWCYRRRRWLSNISRHLHPPSHRRHRMALDAPSSVESPPSLRRTRSSESAHALVVPDPQHKPLTRDRSSTVSHPPSRQQSSKLPSTSRVTARPPLRVRGISLPNVLQDNSPSPYSPRSEDYTSLPDQYPPAYSFTIAVLGFKGVGKSTVISKGFKKLQVTKGERQCRATGTFGHSFTYGLRRARVMFGSPNTNTEASLAEIDILEVNLEDLGEGSFQGWPGYLPHVDAIYICYDVTDSTTYQKIPRVLTDLRAQHILTLVLACKSDLTKEIDPRVSLTHCRTFSAGLVEVDAHTKRGKDKMRALVDWTVKTLRKRHSTSQTSMSPESLTYMESPVTLDSSTVDTTRDTNVSVKPVFMKPALPTNSQMPSSETFQSSYSRRVSKTPISSLTGHFLDNTPIPPQSSGPAAPDSESYASRHTSEERVRVMHEASKTGDLTAKVIPTRSNTAYQQLDQLTGRLFYVAVTGGDPDFVDHFFLTYRRFTTPRQVLLAFQKRLNSLCHPNNQMITPSVEQTSDPDRGFSKMRLFGLLELWTRNYRADFSVPGASKALGAILTNHACTPELLTYAMELFPFFESLNKSQDLDEDWALPSESDDEQSNDETWSLTDQSERSTLLADIPLRSSFPPVIQFGTEESRGGIRLLRDVALKINSMHPQAIAQEISRIQRELFLAIKPRDWIRHILIKDHKCNDEDAVQKFSCFYNHLGSWVTSLILCHETPKTRAKQVVHLVEIGKELRRQHNYAGLRTVTVGILNATFEGDRMMEIFQEGSPKLAKTLTAYSLLFSSSKSYGTYRMAIRGVHGPLIPEMEVHTYDIARLQDISPDFHPNDKTLIHWGKFDAIGKLVGELLSQQKRCRESTKLTFTENPIVKDCIMNTAVMDLETQHSRIPPPDGVDQNLQSSTSAFINKRLTSILR